MYFDTCVLVAAYCPEPMSQAAQTALQKAEERVISSLCEVEICSALALKTRTGEIDVPAAARVLAGFRSHLAEGQFRVVSIQAREYALAAEWISRFDAPIRTIDALHMAAAHCNDRVLISSDRRLVRSARHLGVKHRLLA